MEPRVSRLRTWLKGHRLKAALLGGFVVFLVVVALGAVRGPSHSGVRVVNDLDHSIAINPRCWSRSASGADPVFVDPGEEVVIQPGGACMIHGPTVSDPLGVGRLEGPYIGCLFMPDESERDGVVLGVSGVDRNASWASCDESRSE